ncbi:MAG: hypothetical protein ABR582_14485 [Gemmatimonadaceae bacterium]
MGRFTTTTLLTIQAVMLLAACDMTNPPENLGLMGIKSDVDTSSADGLSVVNITATVDPVALPRGSVVAFTTSAGTLTPATASIPVDSLGRAVVQLKAPVDPASARLTATMNGVTLHTSVVFKRAFPDSIFLSTDHLALEPKTTNNTAKLTVTTWRATGLVSPGQLITLAAYAQGDASTPRGALSPTTVVNAAQPSTVIFFADSIIPAGVVEIRAQMMGSNQSIVTGTANIIIIVRK